MKKYFYSILIVVVAVFCMSTIISCSAHSKFISDSDSDNRDQQFEQLLYAIQNADINYLKSLFSKQALAEVEDFDLGVDRLLIFFDGDVISYEFKAEGIDDKKNDGIRITKKRWWYSVSTSTEEYLFFFLEYPRDEADPDNIGLYMLQVIKAEDRKTLFDGGQAILHPGIYVPDEYFGENGSLA